MNSYAAAGIIAPVVRYEPQYARLLGRWLLHVAANANLFYPDTLPTNMQSSAAWVQQTGVQSISYEGVRHLGATTPYATGDATEPIQDLNPYGAWGSGYMAALFQTSNVPGILQIDCVATEAFPPPACPTFLLYNPYAVAKQVTINVGPNANSFVRRSHRRVPRHQRYRKHHAHDSAGYRDCSGAMSGTRRHQPGRPEVAGGWRRHRLLERQPGHRSTTVCPTGGKADTSGASPTRCRKALPPTDSATCNATGSGWTRPIPAPLSRRKPRSNPAPVTRSSPGIPSAEKPTPWNTPIALLSSGTGFTPGTDVDRDQRACRRRGHSNVRGRLHSHRWPARGQRTLLPGQVGGAISILKRVPSEFLIRSTRRESITSLTRTADSFHLQ